MVHAEPLRRRSARGVCPIGLFPVQLAHNGDPSGVGRGVVRSRVLVVIVARKKVVAVRKKTGRDSAR